MSAEEAVTSEWLGGYASAAHLVGAESSRPAKPETVEYCLRVWRSTKAQVSYPDLVARCEGYIAGYLSAWGF